MDVFRSSDAEFRVPLSAPQRPRARAWLRVRCCHELAPPYGSSCALTALSRCKSAFFYHLWASWCHILKASVVDRAEIFG